jgi:hypothetical protein
VKLSSIGIGLLLIAVAVVLLLGQADVLDAGEVIGDWWPVALIWLAVVQWLSHPRNFLGPLLLGIIGLALLSTTADAIDASPVVIAFSVLLLAAGGLIIHSALRRSKPRATEPRATDSFVVFGGREIVCRDDPFTTASITSVFGGTELDLSEATLSEQGATIDVLSVFGGAEITVPRDWKVDVRVTSILGGVADQTTFSPTPGSPEGTLVLDGLVLFGGAEVKNPEADETAS